MPQSSCKFNGYTLLELLSVVAIIAIIAAIIAPNYSSNQNLSKLDAAAAEILSAIRHAQSRSESHGLYSAVRIQENTTLEVLEVDAIPDPPEATATQVIHPLSKRPYIITLSERPATLGVTFDTTDGPFVHPNSSTTEFLFFDPHGRPYVVGATGIGFLAATNLDISLGSLRRELVVDNISGRVSIAEP